MGRPLEIRLMNLRRPVSLSCLLFCTICLVWTPLLAQSIPADAKTSANAAPHRQAIEAFVQAQLERLTNTATPAGQSSARDALIGETVLPGQQAPSPSFLDIYADVLNAGMMRSVANHDNMRVRLLGAIVTARVAERAGNVRLLEATEAFLQDQSSMVALWGMKSARHVMGPLAQNPVLVQQNRLLGPIVQAVEQHRRGALTQEAYDALAVDARSAPETLRQVTTAMHRVFEQRVARFREQVPQELQAENRAVLFLSDSRVWAAQQPEQQARTMHLIGELVALVGQHAAQRQGTEREPFVAVLRQSARATQVVAEQINNESLLQAAREVDQLRQNSPAEEIAGSTTALQQAIQAAFPDADQRPPVAGSPQ
jgi:hypothetical protein